jgi:hypothetical protein
MVFIPRDPVMQNQFLVHDSSKGTTATAGAVVSLSASEKVEVVSGTLTVPYGFLMQNVKAESSAHPTGFRLPGDLGSSDAFTGDPVGVAHLGLYDTTFYDTAESAYTAGGLLGVTVEGKVTNNGSGNDVSTSNVAVIQNSLDTTQIAAGASLRIKLLI